MDSLYNYHSLVDTRHVSIDWESTYWGLSITIYENFAKKYGFFVGGVAFRAKICWPQLKRICQNLLKIKKTK